MPLRTLKIEHDSPQHRRLLAKVSSRVNLAQKNQSSRHERWRRAEELVLAYIPESEADATRRHDRDARGTPRYTTIMLPYTYALLMSAHTYWTSVFFARTPVHQFAGRHGETEQQILALEALISYQVDVGEFLAPYYIWLYDTGKYGMGVLGHYWCSETISYGELVEMPNETTGALELYQTTREIAGYQGNKVYNVSPYDFWHDPRVPVTRFQDGEFALLRKRMGWNSILKRARDGYFINVDKMKEHVSQDKSKSDGSSALERPDFSQHNFEEWDEKTSKKSKSHPAGMSFLELYIELVPSEWELGPSNRPQKWCITVTEDLGLIVGASPLSYWHGKFPIDILEMEVEGYGLYNRGIPDIMEPVQNTMDWLINTHFFNVRAAMNNQFIIDPSKLVIKDALKSGTPGFIWRLRPEAYGTDIRTMFHQVPVHDVTQGHVQDLQNMIGVGERTLGINDQIMGVLNTGGRKTATEVRTSTGFGVNRQKTITEYMSAHGFASHAMKLVQTSQQMYDARTKLRIVGDQAQAAGLGFMEVTPEDIAGFYSFVPVDGTLPVDRQAQANLWKEILMGITRMPPQIMAQFDMGKIFAWTAQLGGIKNINQMKVQVMPNEQLAQQAQAGNVVPLRPPGAGGTPGIGSPDVTTTMGQNAMAPQPGGY
jgi:hypothetical protein